DRDVDEGAVRNGGDDVERRARMELDPVVHHTEEAHRNEPDEQALGRRRREGEDRDADEERSVLPAAHATREAGGRPDDECDGYRDAGARPKRLRVPKGALEDRRSGHGASHHPRSLAWSKTSRRIATPLRIVA